MKSCHPGRVSHRLRCGTPEVETLRLTFEQVRQRVVGDELIASARLDDALDALDTAGSVPTSPNLNVDRARQLRSQGRRRDQETPDADSGSRLLARGSYAT